MVEGKIYCDRMNLFVSYCEVVALISNMNRKLLYFIAQVVRAESNAKGRRLGKRRCEGECVDQKAMEAKAMIPLLPIDRLYNGHSAVWRALVPRFF